MIPKIYLGLICTVLLMAARCDGQTDVTKIEFTSLTRGYQKQLFADKDSLIVIVSGRESKVVKGKMPSDTWNKIQEEIAKIDLTKVSEFKSPGNKRAFDGAMHSTLKFVTSQGAEMSHGFDDQQPHAALKPVLDLLVRAEKAGQ